MSQAKLIIGADLVPTASNLKYFNSGDVRYLFGDDLLNVLSQAECRIFNLEVPLTDIEKPIAKCGPNLIAPASAIRGYKAIGTDILTLANNHILDQGTDGLKATCQLLEQSKIGCLGVGDTLEGAAKPYRLECGGKKIGIYACAEHEFSIVTEHSPGANPFDPLESPDHVADLKKRSDYVVVLYHGGKEHYRYPSPNLQKVCRKLVERGADLVICQHTHCIGCEEKYRGGTIVYGQGNFLFDHSDSECWQTSLLVQVNDDFSISYIPLVKKNETVRLAEGAEGKAMLADFETRSLEIKKTGVVEEKYAEFAKSMLDGYLLRISGTRKSLLFRGVNKFTGRRFGKWMLKRRYGKEVLLAVENYLNCEAHRELLLYGIRGESK